MQMLKGHGLIFSILQLLIIKWECQAYDAEIVETTFVRSRFLDIRHGYDFVPSRIQKKQPEKTVV